LSSFSQFIQSIRADGNDGKAFEVFSKWFLKHDPEWSALVDEVWLWDEWPDKWGPDCGIDLIFRHKNGETWAIQAKCYDSENPVTKKDMDAFLSETSRTVIHKRLLLASTDLMSANAVRTCNQQEKDVVRYMRKDFEEAAVDYPVHVSELSSVKPKPKPTPRPHQEEAIDAIAKGLATFDRGQLIMACGTGKTFTTLWIKERLRAARVLVLLPSLNLLGQTMREWTAAQNQPFDVLCVCSDKSVGRKSEDMKVREAPFPVTSQISEIEQFLQGSGPRVVFCTYQSSALIAEAQRDNSVSAFDLVVADEAHRCAGKADATFSKVLDGDAIRAKKRLFTTATPRVYADTLSKKAAERGFEIIGMDDVAAFGLQLHSLTFAEAIKRGLLTDYQVVIVGVDRPSVKRMIDEVEIISLNQVEATDAKSLGAKIGLLKAIKDYDLKRVISFHSRVKSARDFSVELSDIVGILDENDKPQGSIWTEFVSGEMSAGERTSKIKKLKQLGSADRGLLTNARCLSEGVDVPALDGVAFLDPKGSQVDIVQAVGRAIRLSDSKEVGTIVLPVFIEDGDDTEASIEASNFKPVWDVLKALRSHDETLASSLDEFRTNMAKTTKTNGQSSLPKIIFDLPVALDPSFPEALRTVLVERTTTSWNFWFGLLERYVADHGSALAPLSFVTTDGYKLGAWINGQRTGRDSLTSERYLRLESLKGWDWDPLATQWSEGFDALVGYVAQEGTANVPRSYVASDGFALGGWISNQRTRKDRISSERRALLEALKGWDWDPLTTQWNKRFDEFTQFVAQEGTTLVPEKYRTPEGYPLGYWVRNQRGQKDSQTPERRARLEALEGWDWDPLTTNWDNAFDDLAEYIVQHGSANVPHRYVTSVGFRLGKWVDTQRNYRENVTLERSTRLESLDGWDWEPASTYWNQSFDLLVEYVAKEGTALVPSNFVTSDGRRLGNWVTKQRMQKDRLISERRAKFEALEGWAWDAIIAQWEEGFNALAKHVAQNGKAIIPKRYVTPDGFHLGPWIARQRRKKNSLTAEQRLRLEAIEGWDWHPLSTQWNNGFDVLVKYVAREGTALVSHNHITEDGFNLGTWITTQRVNKDSLIPERCAKLEALEGWAWDAIAAQWEEGFKALAKYVAQERTATVIQKYVTPEGFRLGAWVARQRRKKDSLTIQQQARLEALEDWDWDPFASRWNKGLEELAKYVAREKTAMVPHRYVTQQGYNLGTWVITQRTAKASLTLERRERLEAIQGWAWTAK
jgi:superfamily II DNA or RNA helicase